MEKATKRKKDLLREWFWSTARFSIVTLIFVPVAVAQNEQIRSLEVVSTASEARMSESVLVLVSRRAAASHASVTLVVGHPATLSPATSDSACAQHASDKSTITWASGALDSEYFCVTSAKSVKTRVVAVAIGSDGISRSAQSDLIQFKSPSVDSNPVFMALLTAAVGFVFGIGSTWFSAFTEAYRNRRKARLEAEEFVTKTYFPEIKGHAKAIQEYLGADNDRRRDSLCILALALPATAAAFSVEKATSLTSYFASLGRQGIRDDLQKYSQLARDFNDQANVLLGEAPKARNTVEQESIAKELQKMLERMGFLS